VAKAVSVQDRILALEQGAIQETLVDWLRSHRLVIGSIVGGLLLLAGGSLYWRYQKAVALENLRAGIAAFQAGDAQKALTALQNVGSSSVGSAERGLGLFYIGEAQRALGKNDEAQTGYEAALAQVKRGQSGAYIEQLVLMKLASLLATKGMDAEARQRYEQAAAMEGPFTTDALASAARLAEKLNDTAGAKAHYEKLSTVSPTYPLAEWFQGKAGK
jgi:tetratricopeptide (TPR) repeat protein